MNRSYIWTLDRGTGLQICAAVRKLSCKNQVPGSLESD
jgi:hypothetical protein